MTSEELTSLVEAFRRRPPTPEHPDLAQLRADMEATAADLYDPPPASFEPADAHGVPGEWITATGADRTAAILYFHGGGYGIGSVATHRDLCARLSAASGIAAFSVEYRLAPEFPFPAAVDDALAAYRWVRERGIPAERIVFAGDSAGGGLALSLAVVCRERGEALPAAIACMSPLTDLAHTGDSVRERAARDPLVSPHGSHGYAMRYVGEESRLRHPHASPLYADLTGLPPVFIQVGTEEVLYDDSTRIAAKITEAGGDVELSVWEGMIHIFAYFASKVPESRAAIEQLGDFIARRIGTPRPAQTRSTS